MNRSNAYYLARLRDEHPGIYADYLAGKFKNASAAIRAAGLKKVPSPLDTLKKAWSEASAAERATFRADIGCVPLTPTAAVGAGNASTTAPVRMNLIHVGGHHRPMRTDYALGQDKLTHTPQHAHRLAGARFGAHPRLARW